MLAERAAVAAVWVATAIGVIAVVALDPGPAASIRLALALALSVVVGIVAQLAVGQQRGFVVRLAASTAGSFLIVCAGALVALAAG